MQGISLDAISVVLEAAPVGMLLAHADGTILLANSQVEAIFCAEPNGLIGHQIEELLPLPMRGAHPSLRAGYLDSPQARPMGKGRELFGRRLNGVEFPVEVGLKPMDVEGARRVLCTVVDATDRRQAMEQFRLALEAAPTGMLIVDAEGHIVRVNAQLEKLFGWTRQELRGLPVETLIPAANRGAHPMLRERFFANPGTRAMGAGRNLHGLRRDGSSFDVEVGLNPMDTAEGRFVICSVVDISERRRAEASLAEQVAQVNAALRERDALLQEVHHRVKNNLQVISSIISLQARRIDPGPSRAALEETKRRVQAISLIHETLYQSSTHASVPFAHYIRDLANNLLAVLHRDAGKVNLDLQLEEVQLPVGKALPCGMLLNELITNAFKYGFTPGRVGTLSLGLILRDSEVTLTIADDGPGLPSDESMRRPGSLGLQLVNALVAQLDGSMTIGPPPGARFTIKFPMEG